MMAEKQSSVLSSPRSIVFWRHIVGILIFLLAQHPRLYHDVGTFVGLWLGTASVAFIGAGLVSGLGYLFLTTYLRTAIWRVFVGIGWLLAGLQIFGEWVMPVLLNDQLVKSKSSFIQGESRAPSPTGELANSMRAQQPDQQATQPIRNALRSNPESNSADNSKYTRKVDVTKLDDLCRKALAKKFGAEHDFALIPAPTRPITEVILHDLGTMETCSVIGNSPQCMKVWYVNGRNGDHNSYRDFHYEVSKDDSLYASGNDAVCRWSDGKVIQIASPRDEERRIRRNTSAMQRSKPIAESSQ